MTLSEGLGIIRKVSINLMVGTLAAIVLVSILGVDIMAGLIILAMGAILCIPAVNPDWAAKVRSQFVRQPDAFIFGFLTTIAAIGLGLFVAAPFSASVAVLCTIGAFTLAIKSSGYRRYNILVAV